MQKIEQADSIIRTRVNTSHRDEVDTILGRLDISTPNAIDIRLPDSDWGEETEQKFQAALDTIKLKYDNALRNLAK